MSTHHASDLVERQMRNWELARSQRLQEMPAVAEEVGDFLCLSRQAGINGDLLAARLGEELDWPVFGREILDLMAEGERHRRQLYDLMDEADVRWSGQVLHSFFDHRFVKNDYFKRLCETLLLLARQGHGVFVGRGADLILPADYGFRVRLAAPLEKRVAWYAEARQIIDDEARREIESVERDRAEYFRHHFRLESEDPLRYDMTINLERFNLEQAAELILAAKRIRAPDK